MPCLEFMGKVCLMGKNAKVNQFGCVFGHNTALLGGEDVLKRENLCLTFVADTSTHALLLKPLLCRT